MKGVAFAPPPPSLFADALRIAEEMGKQLPTGANGGLVGVVNDAGVNAAIVSRVGDHVKVVGWIGKEWGTKITGGATATITW